MNANNFDRRLSDWLDDGPTGASEASIAAALGHARAHPRRRDPLAALRRDPMGSSGAIGFGLRAVPIVAVLGLLLMATLALASAGGLFDQRPVVVPPVEVPSPTAVPTETPQVSPSETPQPSPTAPSPSPVVMSVDLVGFGGRALSTIEVVDASGTLVDARTGQPAEDPSDPSPSVRNDPADPATVVLTWYGLLSDTDRRLTIAPDGRTMTLDVVPGCGDLLPVDRALVLTFNSPVPADAMTVTITSEPRTCE
jgi:hypothetical protein